MATTCHVRLFGSFRVEVDERSIPASAWRHRRAAAVVKLLALAADHRLHREELMEGLWPDLAPEAAAGNLRKAIHFARRALGTEEAIVSDGQVISLWPAASIITDAERFASEADKALRSGGKRRSLAVLARYPDALLLDDRYEAWAQGPRERFRRRTVDLARNAESWDQVLELEPLDEAAHRALIRSFAESGDRLAAMKQFEQLRGILHRELGVGPDARTIELYEEILAMEADEPPTPSERAKALLAAGLVAWNRADLRAAERAAVDARSIAVQMRLDRELGEASALLGMVAHARGRWRRMFEQEFIETVTERPDHVGIVFDAHLCLAQFALYGPDGLRETEELARTLLSIAKSAGSLRGQAVGALMLGEASLLSGDLPTAQAQLSSSVDLHRRAGEAGGHALALERLAETFLARGLRVKAARLLDRALALAKDSLLAAHLVVRVHGARVALHLDPRSAAELVREVEGELAGHEVCDPCSMGWLLASVTAYARAGDLDPARRQLERAERVVGMWHGGAWQAAAWEARGILRLAEGDVRQATALFAEAGDLFAREGRAIDEARCRAAAAGQP